MPSRTLTDRDAAGEQVVEHEQAFEQVAAESVDFLHGEHVPGAHVVDRGAQRGPGVQGEAAADLLLEHALADRVERIVLPGSLLLAGADPHQPHQCHVPSFRSANAFISRRGAYLLLNELLNTLYSNEGRCGRRRASVQSSSVF